MKTDQTAPLGAGLIEEQSDLGLLCAQMCVCLKI